MDEINDSNNFCMVFELPKEYLEGYCFGGGHDVNFKMVDWFNPMPNKEIMEAIDPDFPSDWEGVKAELIKVMPDKKYAKKDSKYLVLTDFGDSFLFDGK